MTAPPQAFAQERNQAASAYVGDLDPRVDDALLWELMLQAGPVVNVHLPKDKPTGKHSGFGFVEFASEEDCEYAIKIMNMIKLYGRPIRVNPASRTNKTLDIGANIFVGNLDPEVDEKLLYDTFSAFGLIITTPKIMRDPDSGRSRGFGFISFDSFEASDSAIEAMNGQYFCNRPISVSYAIRKDSKGERHGSAAERFLASKFQTVRQQRPNMMFSAGPAIPAAGITSGMPAPALAVAPPPTMINPHMMGMPSAPPPFPPPGFMNPPMMSNPYSNFPGQMLPPAGMMGLPPGYPPPSFMPQQ